MHGKRARRSPGIACVLGILLPALHAQDAIQLRRDADSVFRIEAASLAITLVRAQGEVLAIAGGIAGAGPVQGLESSDQRAAWRLAGAGLEVEAQVEDQRLLVALRRKAPGSLSWPRTPPRDDRRFGPQGLIVPAFEGVHVGLEDSELMGWLAKRGAMSATADLSMPFLGFDLGEETLTWIAPEPYYVSLQVRSDRKPLAAFDHSWTPNRPGAAYRVVFEVGSAGLLAPARAYRRWLKARGELRTLREKIAANPRVERLIGAAHAYLWGDDFLARHDIPRNKWQGFAGAFLRRAKEAPGEIAGRLQRGLSDEGRKALAQIAGLRYPYRYVTWSAAVALSEALRAERGGVRAAAEALRKAFPNYLPAVERWGDGISIPLLESLHAAGLDRMLLLTSDLQSAALKPWVARRANELGYLFGPYDSYHSIHSPDASLEQTWPTAQFGRELYESGGIVGLDGERSRGFKKRGYHLSPLAARPYVERRVRGMLAAVPYSAWFVDCDAYGEFFDDIHPDHRATRCDDAAARRDRLRWLSASCGLVVGSEGGSAVMTWAVHFSHGVMTPVIGWGDEELKSRDSPYFLGRWWPPDEPGVFFKTVPLHPRYRRPFFDPRDRLPLYQAVFGDCLVATHQWGYPSLKFADAAATVELLELLYNVAPLYHLNRDRWGEDRERIVRHYRFWSPLHRRLALAPLVGFDCLSADRLVQRTTFATARGPIELIANFAERERALADGAAIAPRSITVRGEIDLEQRSYRIATR